MVQSFSENFSKDMLEAVGHLTLACAISEASIGTYLTRLVAHPCDSNQSALLTAGMSIQVKLANMEAYIQMKFPDALPDVKKITKAIKRNYSHRDHICHNISIQQGNELAILRLRLEKDSKIYPIFYTAKQINEFACTLHQKVNQLGTKINQLGVAPLVQREG